MTEAKEKADVCLILEGTYPYVSGGVSAWTHDLIQSHSDLRFHILAILAPDSNQTPVYKLPFNVVDVTTVTLQKLPEGRSSYPEYTNNLCKALKAPLQAMGENARFEDFATIVKLLSDHKQALGSKLLLDGVDTWNLLTEMYEEDFAESSFLDYFWSWRGMMSSLYSIILSPLPEAKTYHALSTGYAGLMLARAKIETGCPALLTEHGIYTNERRIEIASADWLEETSSKALTIDKTRQNLRDMWINTFSSYSRICYEACDEIITLFDGNQIAQLEDGADPEKMTVIPNGVHLERFAAIKPLEKLRPTVALIGRVVPIKDVKNFIRACGLLRDRLPDVKALIMGPTDEDLDYFYECNAMIEHMALENTVTFTGKVRIDDHLGEIDVIVLTSISEAMPLVILEAGACGIPTVATDVGSCKEIIYGKSNEDPWLGEGGVITPLANPGSVADALYSLLTDKDRYRSCSTAIRKRVEQCYDIDDHMGTYRDLYNGYLTAAETSTSTNAEAR